MPNLTVLVADNQGTGHLTYRIKVKVILVDGNDKLVAKVKRSFCVSLSHHEALEAREWVKEQIEVLFEKNGASSIASIGKIVDEIMYQER